MNRSSEIIASRYRILRELGRGGMGVVYLVEHLGTGDHLALKVLLQHTGASPEMVERFKREARAPARIKSEHVVKVTDADVAPELGGAPFLVMELLDGMDLEKVVETRGAMSPQELLPLLRQAATALDKAHAIGITHRDLKPENLFLHNRESGPPILKILDFGISKMNGVNDMASAGLTKSGAMMGTPLYMSPEQALGRIHLIGPPTDIWAMGLIAYRLLTGTIYWQAETIAELMVKVISEPMPPPSTRASCPSAFDAWFARSTDRDPSRRFRTIGEQIASLADVVAGTGASGEMPVETLLMPIVPIGDAQASRPPTLGANTTGVPLARSAAEAQSTTSLPRNRAPLTIAVLACALVVGGGGGLMLWRASGGSSDSGPSRPTSPAAQLPSRPTNDEPAPEPQEPEQKIAADAPTSTPAPSTSTAMAAPLAPSSSQHVAAAKPPASVAKPAPSDAAPIVSPWPTSAKPAPSTAPSPDPKKKYDPSAP